MEGEIKHRTGIKRKLILLEEALRKASDELEEKNRRLTELDKLKSDFVSTVSHELRTPLSIIKEGISLVLDGITGKVNQKQEKILLVSKDNIDRLTRIINDLLDISRIESGKVELTKSIVNISDLTKQVYSEFKIEADKKSQVLQIFLPKSSVDIYVDPDKITQILNNLISNAIKYTPSKGKIKVELEDKKDKVEISISDTGIGIANEDLPKIFDKFQQFDRKAGPGTKGTGLGLAIAKELIQMHKGKIWVDSKVHKGTKVTFALPKISQGGSNG